MSTVLDGILSLCTATRWTSLSVRTVPRKEPLVGVNVTTNGRSGMIVYRIIGNPEALAVTFIN
jgi:hypothetical protein